jgi:hypothetical protein
MYFYVIFGMCRISLATNHHRQSPPVVFNPKGENMAIQQLSAQEIDQVSGGCCLFFSKFFSSCFSNFFKSCMPSKPSCNKPKPPTPPTPPQPA